MNRAGLVALGAFLGALAVCPPARGADPERAARLFVEGRALLKNGDLPAAESRFRESFELDPRTGTLLNLAQCAEDRGQLVAALRTWTDAATFARAKGDGRAAYAALRADDVKARVPRLTVRLGPGAAGATALTLDGSPLPLAAIDAILVDPGTHVVAVVTGRAQGRASIALAEGQSETVTVDADEPAPPPPPPATAPAIAGTPPGPAPAREPWTRPAVYGLAGVGIAALLVGSYFTAVALRDKGQSDAAGCGDETCPNPDALRLRDSAATAASAATIAFVAAGVAAGGALAIELVSRPRTAAGGGALRLVAHPNGVTLVGGF